MRRTLALNLVGLGFVALGVATFVATERVRTDPAALARLGAAPGTVVGLGFLAGLAAAATGLGVWTRGPWLRGAMVAWGLSAAAVMAVVQRGSGGPHEPLWMVVFPYVALVLLIGTLLGYTSESI